MIVVMERIKTAKQRVIEFCYDGKGKQGEDMVDPYEILYTELQKYLDAHKDLIVYSAMRSENDMVLTVTVGRDI